MVALRMSDTHPSDQIDKTLLLFERDRSVCDSLTLQLSAVGWAVQAVHNPDNAHSLFTPNAFKVALIDMAEPENEGVALANELGQADPNLMIILMCSYRAINESLENITLEHYDYLLKPVRLEQLELVMHKGRRELRLVQDNRQLKVEIGQLQQRVQDLEAALKANKSEDRHTETISQIPGMAPRPGGAAIATYEKFLHRSSGVARPTSEVQPVEPELDEVEVLEGSEGILSPMDEDSIISAGSDAVPLSAPEASTGAEEESEILDDEKFKDE